MLLISQINQLTKREESHWILNNDGSNLIYVRYDMFERKGNLSLGQYTIPNVARFV